MMMNDDASSYWSSSGVEDVERMATINLSVATINVTGELLGETSHNHTSTPGQLAASFGVGSVLATLCLITVLGNTLVIHAVRTDRKLQTVSIAHCVASRK